MVNNIEKKNRIFKLIAIFIPMFIMSSNSVSYPDIMSLYITITYIALFAIDVITNNTFKNSNKIEFILLIIYPLFYAFTLLIIIGNFIPVIQFGLQVQFFTQKYLKSANFHQVRFQFPIQKYHLELSSKWFSFYTVLIFDVYEEFPLSA